MIYSGGGPPFKALPVACIRLKVGDFERVKKVGSGDTKITFNATLDQADYTVKADMLDIHNEVIAGAYYVTWRLGRNDRLRSTYQRARATIRRLKHTTA